MNPFDINTMPVDKMSDLFYREDIVEAIRENVDTRKQTVILGVEGVGKTSLLKCAFDRKYRIEKAKNGTLISAVTEFPSSLKDDEIYNHFAEMIVSSVRILAQCGKTEEMEQIVKECKSIRDEGDAPEVYFEKIATTVCHNYEYRIVMVVDNFERFTSSMDITMKHHELLRKLLNWMQYIVATNYDLNEDSLPPGLSGSFFLMTFAQNEIRVGGWSAEQTKEYIEYSLCDSEIKFSEKCIANIHSVTGGIPYLLKMAAHYAYDYIEREKTEEGLKYADLYNQKIVQTILFHWCKMLTPMQIAALRALLKCADDNKIDKAKLRCLYQRGILENRVDEEPQDDEYIFCCRLLGLFCKEGKLELAA
ncbi:MAG: ATP-binding protein, partial [Clostridia bacterium]|nr:ATP-binding protein [Clostridia bacterium]